MTTANINTDQTLFTLGIVLLELPSNIVAKKFGPNRWIPVIMCIWGLVTLCQAFLKNKSGFYATRFLLAAGEAGFIPGMAWYLTRFYTRRELAFRLAIFWGSNSIGECRCKGIAHDSWYDIGPTCSWDLEGSFREERQARLAVFVPHWYVAPSDLCSHAEGAMTILVAAMAFVLLPNTPDLDGRSLLGHSILSARQADILAERKRRDDPLHAATANVSLLDIKDTVLDWRLYGYCLSGFLSS